MICGQINETTKAHLCNNSNNSFNIPFSPPDISELEIDEVVSTIRSKWITTGPQVKLFEREIAKYCGTEMAVCLNSATAAMELALRVLGVGVGDEVITSAYTYTASASVIAHVGAKIVLIDTMPNSYEMDYEKLAYAITEKTKAIIPIDIGGTTADYDKIYELIGNRNIIVLADAAHSFGSLYKGRRSGSVADFTCFSFHAVKNLTTAEGGAITWKSREGLDNSELYRQFQLLSLHGQTKGALEKLQVGSWEYNIEILGYKCNMTDIAAAMGLKQLERYEKLIKRRKELAAVYDNYLLPTGVRRLDYETGNAHLYMVRVPGIDERERNVLIQKMSQCGISCNVHYKPLPMFTAYKNLGFDIRDYPVAYAQYKNEITLPLHTSITDEQAHYIGKMFVERI